MDQEARELLVIGDQEKVSKAIVKNSPFCFFFYKQNNVTFLHFSFIYLFSITN